MLSPRTRSAAKIACILLAGIGPATPVVQLVAIYVVFGFGFGLVNAPITNTAVSGMPREQAGVAAAIATTSRQVGQALGVAVVGAVAGSHAGGSAHAGWWTLAICGAVILVLGFFATTRRATESAERTTAMAIG